MTSSMRESEVRSIVGGWVKSLLGPPDGVSIPVADVERRLRRLPAAAAWAISPDGRVLSVLDPDDTLYTVGISDEGTVLSTLEQSLRGETIIVRQEERSGKPYRVSEIVRESAWSFAFMDGVEFLSLTGTIGTDRNTGGERRDQPQLLAETIAALAERNAVFGLTGNVAKYEHQRIPARLQEILVTLQQIDNRVEPIAVQQPSGSDIETIAYAIHSLVGCVRDLTEHLARRGAARDSSDRSALFAAKKS
jgi:hypothetical protein